MDNNNKERSDKEQDRSHKKVNDEMKHNDDNPSAVLEDDYSLASPHDIDDNCEGDKEEENTEGMETEEFLTSHDVLRARLEVETLANQGYDSKINFDERKGGVDDETCPHKFP